MLSLPIVGAVTEIVTIIATSGALIKGLFDAVTGLRAKSKAQNILAHLQSNSELKVILNQVKTSKIQQNDPEFHKLILDTLQKNSEILSKNELRQIEKGLEQSSLIGERRYVSDIIG